MREREFFCLVPAHAGYRSENLFQKVDGIGDELFTECLVKLRFFGLLLSFRCADITSEQVEAFSFAVAFFEFFHEFP